jgi:uncharacterized secreted protein with C-terminal beta-propeller domain
VVQKEIRKKTRIYGTVAMLSAIVLVALIYVFGSSPLIFPPTETPPVSAMKTFSSYEELRQYLVDNSQGSSYYRGGPLDTRFFGEPASIPAPAPMSADSGATENAGSGSYSTTNIQVAGVDEADIVKTDGEFIYVVSSATSGVFYTSYYGTATDAAIYIVKADPQDARVMSKISLANDTIPAGLFLSEDGNRLVVLASQYQIYDYASSRSDVMLMPYQSDVYTFINVYDVSDKANPVLARNFTISGSYFNSRLIGNYVYAVISQPANVYNDAVALPKVYEEADVSDVEPSRIYYADAVEPTYFTFTTFVGLNILDDAQQPTNMTIMMGGTSTMYVSTGNMYVTYPTWSDDQYTSIYRVHIDGDSLTFEAKGSVPGYVLNQYSMDEHSGYFRVATNWNSWNSGTRMNNVYVLNMSLAVVGRLENLAKNENLHSVRFMGDKCYLVTFKNTDPLFVIDLSQPSNPKVLGALKIPGYSDYLHPYDETHLIGVGKETVEAEQDDFAWYQGVKLSLFDVSDVTNPQQLSKYVIGDRGTDSPVLSDPKAFLFDKSKKLLVIPVNLAEIDKTVVAPGPSAYGTMVWQGVYVFRLTVNEGFVLEGTVTQIEKRTIVTANGNVIHDTDDIWLNSNYWINRALYIGNTLYTVSNAQVKLNSLDTLAFIAEVNLH